jgi:hypothetical protein
MAEWNPYSWMGADSARHYQWYPFMNVGITDLEIRLISESAKSLNGTCVLELNVYLKKQRKSISQWYTLYMVFK